MEDVEEKRKHIEKYCDTTSCIDCKLSSWEGEHTTTFNNIDKACLHIEKATEEELDKAIELLLSDIPDQPNKPAESDMVHHPNHYNYKSMECQQIINVMVEGLPPRQAFPVGAVIKYLYRYPQKGKAIEDLQKAKTYIDMIISELESESNE